MVEIATDIVSLSRIRNELRFPEGDTDQDEFLKDLVKSAASYVSADLNVPLIDVTAYKDCVTLNYKQSLTIVDQYALRLEAIRYQSTAHTPIVYDYYPDIVDGTTYSTQEPSTNDNIKGRIIAIPNASWPMAVSGEFRVFYRRGVAKNDPKIEAYQTLIILSSRSAYNGESMANPSSAYERIATTLVDYTIPSQGAIVGR